MSVKNLKSVSSRLIVREEEVIAARRCLDALNQARYWAGQAYRDTRERHARLLQIVKTVGPATSAFDIAAIALSEAERNHPSTLALQKESAKAAALLEQLEEYLAPLRCLRSGGVEPSPAATS